MKRERSSAVTLGIICLCFMLTIPVFATGTRNINHLNLLLPAVRDNGHSRHVEHHLEAYNGCYEWTSSHPDILEIIEVNGDQETGCSSRATVRVKVDKEYSNTVWITAKERRRP